MTKYGMIKAIAEKYRIETTVTPDTEAPSVDRRLRTVKDLCAQLKIPTFSEMLADL